MQRPSALDLLPPLLELGKRQVPLEVGETAAKHVLQHVTGRQQHIVKVEVHGQKPSTQGLQKNSERISSVTSFSSKA